MDNSEELLNYQETTMVDNARESLGIFEQPQHDITQEYSIEQTNSCADQQTQTPAVKVASTES